MLIAIDHGNYAIKTPHHSFVSGLSEHTVKPPMADEILEYDGRYWTTSGKRLSYMRDKTQDERYFILTLFAIAKELEDTGRYSPVEQIQLAVGLPPEHYGVLKDKFARYFKRDGSTSRCAARERRELCQASGEAGGTDQLLPRHRKGICHSGGPRGSHYGQARGGYRGQHDHPGTGDC